MEKILFALLFLTGCNSNSNDDSAPKKKYRHYLNVSKGSGWSLGSTNLECDSFQMIDTKHAYAWIDGTKSYVVSENTILPGSNHYAF